MLPTTKKFGNAPPSCTPRWMMTYADCMGLLLCVFVVLFSMGGLSDDDRYARMRRSIQAAFGGVQSQTVSTRPEPPRLIDQLVSLSTSDVVPAAAANVAPGDPKSPLTVTTVARGLQITLAGEFAFDRGVAELNPQARSLLVDVAERIGPYESRVEIRGHADGRESLEEEDAVDARDLSYARARSIAIELEQNGVNPDRMVLVVAGAADPLVHPAYTEDARAANRRVQILVTEESTSDGAKRASP